MSGKTTESGIPKVLVMAGNDNVATCMTEMKPGDIAEVAVGTEKKRIVLVDAIPYGHKLALFHLDPGDVIVKYGNVIGKASRCIEAGQHVHVHNVESIRARGDKQ
jgi:altronate dehydratase small subunit